MAPVLFVAVVERGSSVVRFETHCFHAIEFVHVDGRDARIAIDGELHAAMAVVGGADRQQLEAVLHLPLVRTGQTRRRVNRIAGADLVFLAGEVAHDRVARQHIVEHLDRVPMQVFVQVRAELGDADTDALAGELLAAAYRAYGLALDRAGVSLTCFLLTMRMVGLIFFMVFSWMDGLWFESA